MKKMVLAAIVLGLVASAQAAEVGGYFERDGVLVGYNMSEVDHLVNGFNISLDAWSETQRVDRARVGISPEIWNNGPEGQPGFRGYLMVGGLFDDSLNKSSFSANLSYGDGVEVQQHNSTQYNQWYDDWNQKWRENNGAYAGVTLAPVVINSSSVSYGTWGSGGVGKGGVWEEVRGWEYQLNFYGYFLDKIEGEKFLATTPEPTCLVLLSAGGLGLLRRRR